MFCIPAEGSAPTDVSPWYGVYRLCDSLLRNRDEQFRAAAGRGQDLKRPVHSFHSFTYSFQTQSRALFSYSFGESFGIETDAVVSDRTMNQVLLFQQSNRASRSMGVSRHVVQCFLRDAVEC